MIDPMDELITISLLPIAVLAVALVPVGAYILVEKVRARRRWDRVEAEVNAGDVGDTILVDG